MWSRRRGRGAFRNAVCGGLGITSHTNKPGRIESSATRGMAVTSG